MRILILGAGKIGSCIAKALSTTYATDDIVIADPNMKDEDRHSIGIAKKISYDVFANPSEYLGGVDYCINAAPVYDPAKVSRLLQACVKNGTHYLDISEDVNVGKVVREIGESQNSILVAPHCGLAPGLISIIAGDLMKSFVKISSVDMRVGALPKAVANPYLYTCNWSINGLVNEYLNDAKAVVDGQMKSINPFLRAEDQVYVSPVVVDGIEYESFTTSGGIGTLIDTVMEKDHCADLDMMYRTIRYRGHFNAILPNVIRPYNSREAIANSLKSQLTATGDDIIVIFVRVSGFDEYGNRGARVFSQHISSIDKLKMFEPITAIQRTTAGSLLCVLNLHSENNLIVNGTSFMTGFLRQEWIDLAAFKNSRYGNLVGVKHTT